MNKPKTSDTHTLTFTELVRTHQERLYWHIRQMVLTHDDANDLLQNTFMKAWQGLNRFKGESQISTWLYRIATNDTLNFRAREKRRNALLPHDTTNIILNQMLADSYFDGNEAETKLQKAILTLPEKQRMVFNMRFFDEMPYDEMSRILRTSVGALKASYHHASKKVEEWLKQNET